MALRPSPLNSVQYFCSTVQLREAETAARPREAEVAEGRSCGKSLQLSRLLCSKLYSSKFGPTMFCRRAPEDCNWAQTGHDICPKLFC